MNRCFWAFFLSSFTKRHELGSIFPPLCKESEAQRGGHNYEATWPPVTCWCGCHCSLALLSSPNVCADLYSSLSAGSPEADSELKVCVQGTIKAVLPRNTCWGGGEAVQGRRGSLEGQTPRKCPVQLSFSLIPTGDSEVWCITSGLSWPEPKDLGFGAPVPAYRCSRAMCLHVAGGDRAINFQVLPAFYAIRQSRFKVGSSNQGESPRKG